MSTTVVDTIKVVLTFAFLLLAVVVWSSVFKNILEPLNITPGVYTLLLIILAAVALWLFSRSKPMGQSIWQNFWFILVAAIVFIAAVSVANLIESWAKPWFGSFTDSKAWNDFWYAVVITLLVSLILVGISRWTAEGGYDGRSPRMSPRRSGALQQVVGTLPGERVVADLGPLGRSSPRGAMAGTQSSYRMRQF
jgi:hypothetical protein